MEASLGPQPPRKLVAELPVYINPNEEIVTAFGNLYILFYRRENTSTLPLFLSLAAAAEKIRRRAQKGRKLGAWKGNEEINKPRTRARASKVRGAGMERMLASVCRENVAGTARSQLFLFLILSP